MKTRDRIIGGMVGLACGDALGAPAEFMTPQQVRVRWGVLKEMTGGGQWAPGEWTDDTSMALAVAEGLLVNPADPVEEIGRRFLAWYSSHPKDVGNTIRAALSGFRGDWAAASRNSSAAKCGKAAGNGSLMRTLPIALAHTDRGQMLRTSARVSAMTHWDSQAELCCSIYCLWVKELLRGVDPKSAWAEALETARAASADGSASADTLGLSAVPKEVWDRLAAVADLTYDQLQPSGYAGYAVECLEAAVWCCCRSEHFEQALILAVNLAGESDTIGAVAGGAAGVIFGYHAIPKRWLSTLCERKRLENIGERLADLRGHHEVYATPGLPLFEYDEVVARVFAGRNPLTARDVEELAGHGITHVLDLREEKEWAAPGRFGGEAVEELSRRGIERKKLIVADVSAPSAAALDEAAALIDEWLQDTTHRVYVHCRAGNERTGAVLVAWYARKLGLTYNEALRALRHGRATLAPLPAQEKAIRAWLARRTD